MSSKVIETTKEMVQPILDEKELELVDIEYVKEGKNWFLRLYIDKAGGVDITECGYVSEELSEKLDKADPVKDPYFLEVSSPGVERPLKTKADFEANLNKNMYIKLYEPIDGDKEYEGILKEFKDNTLTLEYKIKTHKKLVKIPYDKIAKARLSVMF